MLKSIDCLLDFALVMLVASMAVTVLTQIWTALVNTRGVHLREGLIGLLQQIDARFSGSEARVVIEHILRHPLIGDAGQLGSLVHRDEFTRLLLALATGDGPTKLPELARQALESALVANGVADPGMALVKIRDLALSLELSDPALGASARHDVAILRTSASAFVAKINGWFDPTIDRISARFTLTTRRVALASALLVATAMQLDTIAIMNRLRTDDALRGALLQQSAAKALVPAASIADIEKLVTPGLFPPSATPAEWLRRWSWAKVPGVVLSVLLLSLGAPFWFEMLKNLLRLRSAIAVKDDSQRERRQSPEGHAIEPGSPPF